MKAKKASALILGGLMSLSLFTACGKSKVPAVGDYSIDVDPNKEATIKVAVQTSDEEEGLIKSVAEVFNKTYPNVKVEVVPFTGATLSYMMTAVHTGNSPDIVMATSFEMFQLMNASVVRNLQPYIDAETKAGTFDINEYYPTYMRAGQADFDGDQYLIPRSADRVVCHYNAAIINRANEWYKTSKLYDASKCENLTDMIKNGWTWEDFDYVCSVIRAYYDSEKDLKNRFLLDSNFNWEAMWNPVFESYGVEYIDENKQVVIDSPQTREALEFMKDLVKKRYTNVTSANFYGGEGAFFFHSQSAKNVAARIGQNASYVNGSSGATYKELYDAGRYSEYYNCVTVPVKKGAEKIGAGNAGYCVSAAAAEPDLAWKFLKTLLTQDGQNAMSKNSQLSYVPVRKDMADATQWEWGTGLSDINLSAYTYMSGQNGSADWNCFTDFFLVKPTQASNLLKDVKELVGSYVFDAAEPSLDSTLATCVTNMTRRMKQR